MHSNNDSRDEAMEDCAEILAGLRFPSWVKEGVPVTLQGTNYRVVSTTITDTSDSVWTFFFSGNTHKELGPLRGNIKGIDMASHNPILVEIPFTRGAVTIGVDLDGIRRHD